MRKKEDKAEIASSEDVVCVKKGRAGMWGKLIILGVVIVVIVGGYYGWTIYKMKSDPQAQAEAVNEEKILAIVAKVGNLMVLPNDEIPQVAEIKDATLAAKEQPFLSGSIDGDILIVYANAGKAIVYSPSRNIIVNVGPVQIGNSDQTSEPVTTDGSGTPAKED
ncbi:MAG TPA: hypothetical protein P5274_03120 [Candidatus Paceibacterota bacterium]|nr:hypothetical protein [Candidatus Paceibacterota bacterium]